MGLELRLELRVGRRDAGPELIGRENRQIQLHLFVAAAVLLVNLGIGDPDPCRHRALQLLDRQHLAKVFLELGGRPRRTLHPQHGAVARFADELSVLLEVGQPQQPFPQFRVAHRDPDPPRLGEHGFLVD